MVYVPTETGHWVSEEFARVAEVIQDYDSNLELRWIPPENRKTRLERERPWAIYHLSHGYVVRHCSDKDKPHHILAAVIESDMRQGDVLKRIDAKNHAIEILNKKRELDELESAKDEFEFLISQRKGYLNHKGKKLDGVSLKEIPGSNRAVIL